MNTHKSVKIWTARYAKNMMAVQPLDAFQGFKGRASYLCGSLKARYSHREHAYIMSKTKVEKLIALLNAGWIGRLFGNGFIDPDGEYHDKFPKHLLKEEVKKC